MELWALPVAVLWEPWQANDVVRLVELELLRERGDAKGWIYSGIANLRTTLFLTPKALSAAGVRLEGVEAAGHADVGDELEDEDDPLAGMVAEIEVALRSSRS